MTSFQEEIESQTHDQKVASWKNRLKQLEKENSELIERLGNAEFKRIQTLQDIDKENVRNEKKDWLIGWLASSSFFSFNE